MEGELTVTEAWAIVRPWFVDPSAQDFAMNAVIPESFFMGEYDLVYRWDEKIKIVDLKASTGNNFRSEDYVNQMQMYAMLWWATHEKNQVPDELEIWYAGGGKKKQIPLPEIKELESMYSGLEKLWGQIKGTEITIEDLSLIHI